MSFDVPTKKTSDSWSESHVSKPSAQSLELPLLRRVDLWCRGNRSKNAATGNGHQLPSVI
jgi:hypothetical protein